MRQVCVKRLEGLQGVRVDGFCNKQSPYSQPAAAKSQEFLQHVEREMLDHLRREDGSDRRSRPAAQERDRVHLFHTVALRAAPAYHVGVVVDSQGRYPVPTQQIEHLAPATANVHYFGSRVEQRQVDTLAITDEWLGTSEDLLESQDKRAAAGIIRGAIAQPQAPARVRFAEAIGIGHVRCGKQP